MVAAADANVNSTSLRRFFMNTRIWLALALAFSASVARVHLAQTKSDEHFGELGLFAQSEPVTIAVPPPEAVYGVSGKPANFAFIGSELNFGEKVVKGVPYSAEAVTETVQTLADGNRITRKTTAQIYRDSEGRTRRDQSLGGIGPWAPSGEPHQMSFINDPVAGFHYVLNPEDHTAHKMPVPPKLDGEGPTTATFTEAVGTGPRGGRVMIRRLEHGMESLDSENAQKESLGKQLMEGIQVEGTRSTVTIEAGKIGNELPIQMVSERWYSPELQVVVMSKHSDPRVGETVYRLTNINRSEPAHSLFEIPADYKVEQGMIHKFRKQVEK
jgi:hypothetical protein